MQHINSHATLTSRIACGDHDAVLPTPPYPGVFPVSGSSCFGLRPAIREAIGDGGIFDVTRHGVGRVSGSLKAKVNYGASKKSVLGGWGYGGGLAAGLGGRCGGFAAG